MNQRIREFEKQSGLEIYGLGTDRDKWEHAISEFAQLIVQECVSTLKEMHMWQSVNNQNFPSAWHNAIDAGIENIKEHFGVEL